MPCRSFGTFQNSSGDDAHSGWQPPARGPGRPRRRASSGLACQCGPGLAQAHRQHLGWHWHAAGGPGEPTGSIPSQARPGQGITQPAAGISDSGSDSAPDSESCPASLSASDPLAPLGVARRQRPSRPGTAAAAAHHDSLAVTCQ
jgi:hypothetical protein